MAARFGTEANAKVLVLNHISGKADELSDEGGVTFRRIDQLAKEAEDVCLGSSTSVVLSYDFMEVLVPWAGFGGGDVDGAQEI